MTWNLSHIELQSVTGLSPEQRYNYAVKRIADHQEIWSLRNEDGWVLAGDDEGNKLVPIWPHARFAEQCASGSWANTLPSPIELTVWLEKWTPGMLRDERSISVFSVPSGQGVVASPERFQSDLEIELSKYE